MKEIQIVPSHATVLIVVGLTATLMASTVLANYDYQTAYNGKYPTVASATTCYTCHASAYISDLAAEYSRLVGSPAPGGARIPATMAMAIANIELKDSDGDGYTNVGEILLGNHPGDAANKPNLSNPAAPTDVSAVLGNAQATVSFTAGATGGSTYLRYTVTAIPSGITASGSSSPITVTGLTNGTDYRFSVSASNGKVGATALSGLSNQVSPAAPSTTPTGVSALAGNGQATVSFTVPTSGSASYTATSIPGGYSATGTSSPIVVSGLQNGTSYRFTVSPVAGTDSLASNAIIPNPSGFSVPDAPSATGAVAGSEMALIVFSQPFDGGSPITAYNASCTYSLVAGVTFSFTASSATRLLIITGLHDGTTYKCGLTATNAIGTSIAPDPLFYNIQFVPSTPGRPSVPTAITAVPGNAQATLAFSPPANDGGSPILEYKAYCLAGSTSGAKFTDLTATGSASPLTVTGLTNGTTYGCWVVARNAEGTFFQLEAYPDTVSVTPTNISVPALPSGVSAVAGNAQATVSFIVPSSNGGSAITGYTATSNPDFIAVTGQTSPITVTGLSNGVPYTFTVTATNSAGSSVSLASAAVTPATTTTAATTTTTPATTTTTSPTTTTTAANQTAVRNRAADKFLALGVN